MSEANRIDMSYGIEGTLGVAPATTYQKFRRESDTFNANLKHELVNEIRSDRQVTDMPLVSKDASGGFSGKLSFGTYDDFIAGALYSDWSTDVLTNGVTPKHFTIEKNFVDVGVIHTYLGQTVESMNLSLSNGATSTFAFEFKGINMTHGAASEGTGYTAETTSQVFNAATHISDVTEGGVAVPATTVITNVSIDVNNSLRTNTGIGSLIPADIKAGRAMVTGTITAYMSSTANSIYEKFLTDTATSFSFKVTDDAGDNYLIELLKIKFKDAKVTNGGTDTDVMVELPFQALMDSVSSKTIRITRQDVI